MHSTFVWIRYLVLLVFAACAGCALILAASYLYLAPQLPPASDIRHVEFQIPLRIYSADDKLIAEYGGKRRVPLTYDQFPPLFVQAVLAAEDEHFFEHFGVDPVGLLRAAVELVRYREIRSGGSTITMQVARNFFLTRNQTFLRKFNEIVLAIQIERILTKQQILELYLNKIYLGHHAYGAEAAAEVYYGKPLQNLDLAQWAMIAGLPKAPSAYNPITDPQRAVARRNWILHRMVVTGAITKQQMESAIQAPVTASYHAVEPQVEGAYIGEIVRQEAAKLVDQDIYTTGIRIYTTLDSRKQNAAVKALRDGLSAYDERHGYRGPLTHVDISKLPKLAWPGGQQAEAAPNNATPKPELAKLDEPDPSQGLDPRLTQWVEQFKKQPSYGPLEPAIVTAVQDKQAAILLEDGHQAVLDWDALKWAAPALDNGYKGKAPNSASDVLKPGDVIYVRPVGTSQGDNHWRLAELPQAQAALVSLDPQTGAVRALQGGYSFFASKFNRATQALRQVGSAFKPFIYTAALENGFTPATIINDAPLVFDDDNLKGGTWRPTGAEKRFFGPTRLRVALYRSLNLVSIRVLNQVGIGKTMDTLDQFGLPTDRFPRNLSLALGSGSLSPMELATAYAIFANGGYRVKPWFIERIEDRNGNVLWKAPKVVLCDEDCDSGTQDAGENATTNTPPAAASAPVTGGPLSIETDSTAKAPAGPPETVQPPPVMAPRVLSPQVAWLMYSIMQDVIHKGTGRRALELHRTDLAGKTGTTNDQVDAWFSGFSPALVATVWVGYDSPRTLGRGEYGARAALPIWIEYMGKALDGVPSKPEPQPPGIVTVRIDPQTGLQARPDNPDAIFEYFREGHEPKLEAPNSGGKAPEQIF